MSSRYLSSAHLSSPYMSSPYMSSTDMARSPATKEPEVTIVDGRPPRLGHHVNGSPPARQPAVLQQAPHNGAAQPDRDPVARLEALFDSGSVRPLLPADTSGVLAAEGLIEGLPS